MASNENPKTVLLSGDPVQYEAAAGGAVTPGMVVVYDGGDVVPGAGETLRVARERDFVGEGIDSEVPLGDQVPFYVARKGDRFYCFSAAAITAGTVLEANADGNLIAQDLGTAVAVALEDADGSVAVTRIKVEAI